MKMFSAGVGLRHGDGSGHHAPLTSRHPIGRFMRSYRLFSSQAVGPEVVCYRSLGHEVRCLSYFLAAFALLASTAIAQDCVSKFATHPSTGASVEGASTVVSPEDAANSTKCDAPSAIPSNATELAAASNATSIGAAEKSGFEPFLKIEPIEVDHGFHRVRGTAESLFFLGIMHGFRMTEQKTRRELGGPFWSDYFKSVKGLHGWSDGGKQFTNYLAHPAEGAVFGHIWVNNDPKGRRVEFSNGQAYAVSRVKALLWSALWSTLFEIGPISEASLGNVGSTLGKQAAVDLVITPTVGIAELVAEDAIDRYIGKWIERKTTNEGWRAFARLALNPTRSFSNLLQFKLPWYRATRPLD